MSSKEDEKICSGCSWSPEFQSHCSRLILKERSSEPPNFEVANIKYLASKSSIPIPRVVEEWHEDNGRYFMLMERVPGQTLEEAWPRLSTEKRERTAKQTAEYLGQLRDLQSDRMESIGGHPVYDAFLFGSDFHVPHGPFHTDNELWNEMSLALSKVPERIRTELRRRMPPTAPFAFTHSDLTMVNIMVDPKTGNLTGILDWENSGYFPVWWEFAKTSLGFGDDDVEWKKILRKYMPKYTQAREFWRCFFVLRSYPDLDETHLKVLEEYGLSLDI